MIAAFAVHAAPAAAVGTECPVTDADELTMALGDAGCEPITLAPGTYSGNFAISRTVEVRGTGGAAVTTLSSDSGASVVTTTGAGTVTLKGVTVTGATTGSGINAATDLVLDGVVVRNNTTSGEGGGLLWTKASPGTLTVTDSAFRDNISNGFAGGGASLPSSGSSTFERVLFEGNKNPGTTSAGGGGGLSALGSTTLRNVTMTGNRTNANGGGFRYTGGATFQSRLNNVTIALNTADNNGDMVGVGGGIGLEGSILGIANSIIGANNRGAFDDDCGTITGGLQPTRLGYELIETPGTCTFGSSGPFTDTTTGYQTGVNPMVAGLAANGTVPLLVGSPAIDAGNPATPGSGDPACEAADQVGVSRGAAATGRCDLGAAEFVPAPVVPLTTVANATATTPTKKKCKKKKKKRAAAAKKKCRKKKKH